MNNEEIYKKVKLFEIKSKKHLQQVLAGAYHSVFKGKGIEFSHVKEYTFEDDIKDIDWNVTARSDRCYIKNYIEERELKLIIVLDMSGSQYFGSQSQFKKDLSVELAAILAFSALNNRDQVGLLLFSNKIEKYLPPKKHKNHILRLVRDLIAFQPTNSKTDLSYSLSFLLKTLKKQTIIFVISDFMDNQDFTKPLFQLGRKHDVVCIRVSDPFENQPPPVGYIHLVDSETGEEELVNLKHFNFRKNYFDQLFEHDRNLKNLFRRSNIDYLHFKTNVSYISQLTHFFKIRSQRY